MFSVSSGGSGYSEYIKATKGQFLHDYGSIGETGITHTTTGTANLAESHYVSNTAGDYAVVGVRITGARSPYTYSYEIYPSEGKGKGTDNVWATEALNVPSATYINAYATATNRAGYHSEVSTTVSGSGSSLLGYSNMAYASAGATGAAQSFDSAKGSLVQTSTCSNYVRLGSGPQELLMDYVNSGITVKSGTIRGYTDLAVASPAKLDAAEHMDSSSGLIQTQTNYQSGTGTLFVPKKKPFAFVGMSYNGQLYTVQKTGLESVVTTATGSLTGYNADSQKASIVSAGQTGHVAGTFTTTSTSDAATKTRSSDYGTNYDLFIQAVKDGSGSHATGVLGYYVNPLMAGLIPHKGAIQGAVDTAQAGDTVNADVGTYNENVLLAKSLTLAGSGRDDDPLHNTIIKAVSQIQPVIVINAGGVVVKNLQVTGGNDPSGSGVEIIGSSASGDISGITLRDIASKYNGNGLTISAYGIKISNVDADGMIVSGSSCGYGVNARAYPGGSISGLSLNNAQISGSRLNGVRAVVVDPSCSISGLSMIGGTITGSGSYGLFVGSGSTVTNIVVNHANIYGNTLGGIDNEGINTIDAQYNYWGGGLPSVIGDVKTDYYVTTPIQVPYP